MFSLLISFVYLGGLSYQENCMWDDSCEDDRYNVGFCGNGYCDPFESKDSCLEDCGSILDLIIEKIDSLTKDDDTGGGPLGVRGPGVSSLATFLAVIIAVIIFGAILIWLYNRFVVSVEREVIIGD
ncbi:MAG: hypothetical protein V1718_06065 [archaeon]